ncbi:hypothetical protein [Pelagibaculum spongiae]|uniref:hypothetical protein n=1 Tax=Pelagibaculum spongiae TaxID=2080658 RepID=UPI001057F7B7|nr:hypothetical protein [Pelagibaculum spongiae]
MPSLSAQTRTPCRYPSNTVTTAGLTSFPGSLIPELLSDDAPPPPHPAIVNAIATDNALILNRLVISIPGIESY